MKTFYEQEIERLTAEYGLPEYQYAQVRKSKKLMDERYSEKINLEKLSREACMSRFHFIRIFRHVYGQTPRQYLRDVRILKAKKLLKSGASVSQACLGVGYGSLSTFSAAFRRGTGSSPRDYRKLHFSNPE